MMLVELPLMHYTIYLTSHGGRLRGHFASGSGPNGVQRHSEVPAWTGTFETTDAATAAAEKALNEWLRHRLNTGEPFLRPGLYMVEPGDAVNVYPAPRVALAALLRLARQEHAWSPIELARRVGVTPQQLAELENPDSSPTADVLEKGIAAAGDLTLRLG